MLEESKKEFDTATTLFKETKKDCYFEKPM